MARRFQHLQANASEFENVAIAKRSKRVRRFGRGAEIDRCAHAIAQLQMPGDKIGVEMRQEYVLDLERVLGGKGNVLIRVPLRVNDGRRACLLVSDHVGSVRQARQIELLEDHVPLAFLKLRHYTESDPSRSY